MSVSYIYIHVHTYIVTGKMYIRILYNVQTHNVTSMSVSYMYIHVHTYIVTGGDTVPCWQ